jgi:hypothetical protein
MHHVFTTALLFHVEMCAISPRALHDIKKVWFLVCQSILILIHASRFYHRPSFSCWNVCNFSKSFTWHKKGLIPGLPINLDSYPCITFLPPPFFCMLKCVQFLQELYMTLKRSDSWSANQSWFLSMHHFCIASLLLHVEMCAISPRALHITRRWMVYYLILNSGECWFQLLFI